MPEEAEPKKEASEEEKKPQKKGISPIGIGVGLLFLVVAGGVVFFFVARSGSGPKEKTPMELEYAEVDLGQVSYNLNPSQNSINPTFMCNPVLILNHDIEDVSALQSMVEERKNLLRGLVLELIAVKGKTAAFFQDYNALTELAEALRDIFNDKLGKTEHGQTIVLEVIFTEFQTPSQ